MTSRNGPHGSSNANGCTYGSSPKAWRLHCEIFPEDLEFFRGLGRLVGTMLENAALARRRSRSGVFGGAVMKFDAWLDHATSADRAALAVCLRDGRIPFPPRASAIQLAGFGEGATAFLLGLSAADPHIVAYMLERLRNAFALIVVQRARTAGSQ